MIRQAAANRLLSSPTAVKKLMVAVIEGLRELKQLTTMAAPGSLTAACSTVELLRNGSHEF